MEKKYEIERFEKTIQKHYKDVQKYDVARFEYGDYDNWVTAIIIEVKHEPMDFGGGKHPVGIITFQTVWGEQITCYDNSSEERFYLDLVGKAKLIKNEKQEDITK